MKRTSLFDLSQDEWLEICKFLSPCDSFRLSQSCRWMYHDLFGLEEVQQDNIFHMFFELIKKQAQAQLQSSLQEVNLALWFVSDEENEWMERNVQSRKDWKNLMRIYLKLSYLKLKKLPCRNNECEFLIYQPFSNISSTETASEKTKREDLLETTSDSTISYQELNLHLYASNDMQDPVLVHGYRDGDGTVRIFNWERHDSRTRIRTLSFFENRTTELFYSADNQITKKEQYFKTVIEWCVKNYKAGVHDLIQTQEFMIPNLHIKSRYVSYGRYGYPKEIVKLQLHKYPSEIHIYTNPFTIQHTFPISILLRHIPFYIDLVCLLFLAWFGINYKFCSIAADNEECFRHGRTLLSLPFSHSSLEGHPFYQYFHLVGFWICYLGYGIGIGFLGSLLLPDYVTAIATFLIQKALNSRELIEYPATEERPLRSPWNLLAIVESGQTAWYALSSLLLCKKMLCTWGSHFKRSIVDFIHSTKKKSSPPPNKR